MKDTLQRSWQKILLITPSCPSKKAPPSPVLAGLYDLAVSDDEVLIIHRHHQNPEGLMGAPCGED